RPERRLLLGREIENDAEAERHREPGREPPRADIRQHPADEALRSTPSKAAADVGPYPSGRPGPRPPRPRPPARACARTCTRLNHRGVAPHTRAKIATASMLYASRRTCQLRWLGDMRSIAVTCGHGADAQVDGIAHAVVRLSPKTK